MNADLEDKYNSLIKAMKEYGSAAIAFSGGVDSTFLSKVAFDTLGEKSLAITVDSEADSPDGISQARELAHLIGIRLVVMNESITQVKRFMENPPDRCYYCKKTIFSLMQKRALHEGMTILMDGSHADDTTDYRPGMRALVELGIKSPLADLGFKKDEIRALSKELGLPTWNQQSYACLASRFPYGQRITPELLERTWRAETVLKNLGVKQFRVRNHGDIARIEVDKDSMELLMNKQVRDQIVTQLKSLGYTYVALDLEGYRTGSMNEVLR